MKKFRKLLAIILSLGILATLCAVPMVTASADTPADLKFDNNGKFKIVIFSDVQDQFPVTPRVVSIMEQAITRENPDLVVFLGDITEQNIKDPEIDYRRSIEQIMAPVANANVPYAIVFGNHDDQSYYSNTRTDKAAMLSVIQSIGDCRTIDASPSLTGTGTCKIPIYASTGNSVAFDLFMVDSNTYQNPTDSSNHGGYDNPHADQLAWLAANKDAGVNSLVFQHIPMPEIYNLLTVDPEGEKTYGSTTYAKTLNSNASGYLGEYPCPPNYGDNTGEFAALKAMGGVLGVFTGHDHLNDFTGTYDGLTMTAVPGMTYYNYGNESVRGYGVIELDESDLSTYDYETVKFSTLDTEAGASSETTYDTYDTVTYADLRKNGDALPANEYNIHGSNTFTYSATSPSYSAKFKFRYTVGADTGIQFSFDEGDNGNIANPFGVWVKKPNQGSAGANGAWHLRPDKSSTLVNMSSAAAEGDTYDIELGRLKVVTGTPEHVGQYYVYLKVNGTLIQETYTNTDSLGRYMSGNAVCQISNKIRFGDWSANDNNNKISPFVEERYESYDVITYSDLYTNESKTTPVAADGETLTSQNNNFYYNATSPTHSAIYKIRWVAGDDIYFQLYPGKYTTNPFAYRINESTFDKKNAPGNTSVSRAYTINEGDAFDLEVARLMVANGENAGKYYTYFKVNDHVLFEEYVTNSGIAADALFDGIQFNLRNSDGHYCTIKSSTDNPDSTYYDYDEVTYYDLIKNDGNKITSSTTNLSGGITYTYNATSPTYSAIFRFRYICGSTPTLQFSFDKNGDSAICHPFGVWIKAPNANGAGATGAWHLKPNIESLSVPMTTALQLYDYKDIELGRLKVKNGDPSVVGKYYVYLKVNGELIQEGYSEVDDDGFYTSGSNTSCRISNKIFFGCWGNGGSDKMSASQNVGEEYAPYDEVYYGALYKNGTQVSSEGSGTGALYSFNQTSETKSAIVKVRWKAANAATEFQMSFDRRGAEEKATYMFGVQLYAPNAGDGYPYGRVWLRPGYGPETKFKETLVTGTNYDLEFARLKVVSGPNTGRWFVYLKINDEMVACDYVADTVVDGNGTYVSNPNNTTCTLSNELYMSFWGGGGATLTNPPFTETYEEYDEVYYSNLLNNGTPVGNTISGTGTYYTYNGTSDSKSAIFKTRWIPNGNATELSIGFDYRLNSSSEKKFSYMFGMQLYAPNAGDGYEYGRVWLRPGYGPEYKFGSSETIVAGNNYDLELARLKVATGPNKGKYYVYFKLNGALLCESYVAANVVQSNGTYISNPSNSTCTLGYGIHISSWGGGGATLTNPAFDETYYDYDNIGYSDLIIDGTPAAASGTDLTGGNVLNYTRTSETGSAILKYRWKVGSLAKFQLSFEKKSTSSMAYMFGAWLAAPGEESGWDNGRMWLRPSYGNIQVTPPTLASGTQHNVEFARLKVASGPNKDKYLVYIKIDDVLLASDYVAADIVDSEGNYTTSPSSTACSVKSGEIFMSFFGTTGNAITAYKASFSSGHEGTICDFDENLMFSATDITGLIGLLIGRDEYTTGMGDFNRDDAENILDLVAMKKYLTRSNTHTKSGSLKVGTQEHILEDETKTSEYIADASATLGSNVYRLSRPIHTLYTASSTNGAVENTSNMEAFEAMVDDLIDAGITEILYVSDTFVPAYGYYDSSVNHHKTVPDPSTEAQSYQDWLDANTAAYAALAAKFEGKIKYFEPFNEINTTGTRFEKSGANWSASSAQQAACKYTVTEKAAIIADLCWNVSTAVKSVNKTNQVTTPSICTGSNASGIEPTFLNTLYNAIESGAYPSNQQLGDIKVDDFFTVVNLHIYPQYGLNASQYNANLNTAASDLISCYDTARAHGDGASEFWITETGVANGYERDMTNCGNMLYATLSKFNTSTTFIDAVIIYKLADMSTDAGAGEFETTYGLFYSGDDLDHPYEAKEAAKAVYKFTHGGSTDYSALNSLVSRWAS